MKKLLTRQLRSALHHLKGFAKRSELAKTLLYDRDNQDLFTDLRWHEKMLADSARVNAYRDGMARRVRPGDVVIDLGTGTGLLAFFAAKGHAKKVYAIDHSDFIEVAQEISKKNGIANIEFVRTNSREFSPPEPADVIVHEQLGRALFGENMIENLLDLKRRALKPSGYILPAQFDLFIEPVVMKQEHWYPNIWEIDGLGFDLGFLKHSRVIERFRTSQHLFQSVKGCFVSHFLCEPEELMSLDINKIASAHEIPTKFEISRAVTEGGTLDGFCVYFRVRFDEQISFDTSPIGPQTSWDNLVLRAERTHFDVGDQISYSVDLSVLTDTNTWRVSLKNL